MKNIIASLSRLVILLGAVLGLATGSVQAQVTYSPSAWVNDPFTTNANFALFNANTTFPTYTNTTATFNGNLYGFSPIGATILLTNAGDSVVMTEQITLTGNVNNGGNVQFRTGIYYKGPSANDVAWMGYQIGQGTPNGGGLLYLLNTNNTTQFGNTAAATIPGLVGVLASAPWNAATYDFRLSITRLGAASSLVKWTLSGQAPNTFLFAARYTNNSVTSGGFLFDQVGFLKGAAVFNGAGGTITLSNVLVTVGQFSDGTWTNDANGLWSTAANWNNGIPANGIGFLADFSQVNLTADRTITLDSARTIGGMLFGATSGLNNWSLNSSGGSALTLDSGVPGNQGLPNVAVNQNTATVNLSFNSANGLAKTGPGNLVLRGTNGIVGPLTLNGGVVNFLSLSNLPFIAGSISTINLGAGVLQWAPGNTFDLSAPVIPINFNGAAGFDVGANNVTMANTFGNAGAGGLTKLGSGTLTFNGQVFYAGATVISNGVLAIGSSGSIPSTVRYTILSGATLDVSALAGGLTLNPGQTLSGTGTVLGNVADSGGSIIAPGTSAGTLTVNGNLSLNGSGVLNYELSDVTTAGSGINDLVVVTSNLTITAATTLNLFFLNGAPGLGTYTLFTYDTFTGNAANLIPPPGFAITNDTAAKIIGLVVTHIPGSLTWLGDGIANVWDTAITTNWLQSGTNQVFFPSDSVTFDNTGSNTPPIDISGVVLPNAISINASQDYTFYTVSAGGIGTGRLTKSGSGTLILETDNTYAGPTVINGGVLQLGGINLGGASGTLGTGPTTNNAGLVFNRSANYTYANVIRGTGSITNVSTAAITLSGGVSGTTLNHQGSGTWVLSASNNYTGQTIISSGSVNPRNSFALGTTAGNTVISNGGRLYIDANVDILGEAVTVAGSGPDAAGALRKGGNGVTTFSGAVALTGDSMIAVDGGSTLNLTNNNGIPGSGFSLTLAGGGNGNVTRPITLGIGALTKNDGGTWTVAATNNYGGKTIINGGNLAIPAPTALGTTTVFAVDFVTLNGGSLNPTTNITFADGLRGFTVSGIAGGINLGAGLTIVISNHVSGLGTLTKIGGGTLVLNGSNSFSGTLNVDNASITISDGTVRVAHPHAISDVVSPIAFRNSLGGSSTLELDGTAGSITITQAITFNGRSPAVPAIKNNVGNNTLANNITVNNGGIRYLIQSDSGLLTISGNISPTMPDPQSITFQGTGNILVSGIISDGTNVLGVIKEGAGGLTLNGVNTYTGQTLVNGGTLRGTGTIVGPVFVQSGGTLSPGASIGTLTINNSLSLAGNTFIEVNQSSSTSDQVAGVTSVSYGGTLTVTNLSGTLVVGNSFPVFPAVPFSGNFTSISPAPGPGLAWNFSPSSGVLSVVAGLPNTPTNITFSVVGGNLNLSWPQNYKGWILQSQTNSLNVGISNNWADVTGSSATNSVTVPIGTGNPTVFFRLRYP